MLKMHKREGISDVAVISEHGQALGRCFCLFGHGVRRGEFDTIDCMYFA